MNRSDEHGMTFFGNRQEKDLTVTSLTPWKKVTHGHLRDRNIDQPPVGVSKAKRTPTRFQDTDPDFFREIRSDPLVDIRTRGFRSDRPEAS